MIDLVMPSIRRFGHALLALCWICLKPVLLQICSSPALHWPSPCPACSLLFPTIPVARMHSWTSKQYPVEESSVWYQNRWRRLGVFCAILKHPNWNGFSLGVSPRMKMLFDWGCPPLLGYMVSIRVTSPRTFKSQKLFSRKVGMFSWLIRRQRGGRRKRNGYHLILQNQARGRSLIPSFISFVCWIIY